MDKKEFIFMIIAIGILIAGQAIMYQFFIEDHFHDLESINESMASLEDKIQIQNQIMVLKIQATERSLQDLIEQQSRISDEQQKTLEQRNTEIQTSLDSIQAQNSGFSQIIERVMSSVVAIKTNIGEGSGVIFAEDGLVMTNLHVVNGARTLVAVDHNSETYAVKILGYSEPYDLAVLKIESDKVFDYLGFADNYSVGERVIAIGNPLGLSSSVSEGIISGIDRQIDDKGFGYIQSDVSINPGNSGGPLVDTEGKVVGITTLKITNTEGLGFAIPANLAEDVAQKAIEARLVS